MEIRETAKSVNPHMPVHTHAHTAHGHSPRPLTSTQRIWEFTSFELKNMKLWLPETAFLVSENLCSCKAGVAGDPGGEIPGVKPAPV